MTEQNQYTIVTLVAIVAFIVGQSMGAKGTTKKADAGTTTEGADAPASMDWFVNWSGLK